ncbi:bifunctional DNA-binding transcriptional regulator/O6-methylguanine-DNA methyltransferase Ada [Sphingomonas paeninsulae]|uniref:methylated-DNA--[protein]-cysteine S-methyltransferase n=1 Tax=Sphingomonas paeninsulae TaxID=2319844 RepID=A0A494TD23_SPHPE|nr:bifunctional DNA-binding transcriptional regulator/O6-methylguanine-DNA methyltransferase Ada [Sphingomonas paeninsulae]AYJ87377.1 bifunctional DNA-binding transcriptional regulator/O6-methylguanine-DNA methyltransferase Ada [Sphingomonas paeninsulae]
MNNIDTDKAWAAFLARDRLFDGQFVGAVKTTGIYCKPSCAARHPLRQNMAFYADGAAARAAGFRACLRCRPDEIGRDREAVAKALAIIEAAEEIVGLEALAFAVGYAPHHFHRLFKRDTGVTPAAYARGLRAKRAEIALEGDGSVTEALYDAGYQSPSRFYAAAPDRLGMTPSAWKRGGAGVVIRYAIVETTLGSMMLAATDRGICRLSFDEDETELRLRFPNATIEAGGEAMAELVDGAVAAVADPAHLPDLPLDIAGTVFQQAVWRELARIPAGQTLSYAALAAKAGNPKAVRAAGTACGANQVSVLIPCHRALRTDGTLGGYAYGLERKIELLKREAKA